MAEIDKALPVQDSDGLPINFGWSRQPHFFYDPALFAIPRRRVSESDRFIVHTPTHLLVFEIRDDGILGFLEISVISLRDKKRSTQIFNRILPLGAYELPAGSEKDTVNWRYKKNKLNFICMDGGIKIIKADIPKFGHHRSMRGALVLTPPVGFESIVTNQSWRNQKKVFRYSRCSPCYSVEGLIQFGSSEIIFTKGNGWGIFEWNRGARPKNDIRYWAAACGICDGRLTGFSVGYSLADSQTGTENAFFVDGKLHKLDQVTFHIPLTNWLSPWRFTSNDNRLEMTFFPHQERIERRSFLLHSTTRRQVAGFFSGKAQLDDGAVIEFHYLTGFAERSKIKL